jgi:hypothetical protein
MNQDKNPNINQQDNQNEQDNYYDKRVRNYEDIQNITKKIAVTQTMLSQDNPNFNRINELAKESDSLANKADKTTADIFNQEYNETGGEFVYGETEADKKVQANYSNVIEKQSSGIKEADIILRNRSAGVMDTSLGNQYEGGYNSDLQKREELILERKKLLEQGPPEQIEENNLDEENIPGNISNKYNNVIVIDSDSDESPKDKGKRRADDYLNQSTSKRSKKDDEGDKGENTTDPGSKSSLTKDFADTSLEMPDYTAGDD